MSFATESGPENVVTIKVVGVGGAGNNVVNRMVKSGVVFMLIVLASFAGMRTGTIPLTLILVLILYLGSEIFQAVTGTAGLAQLTHIAGGVLGMIFGFTWSRGKRAVR